MKFKKKIMLLSIIGVSIFALLGLSFAYLANDIIGNEKDKIQVNSVDYGTIRVSFHEDFSGIDIAALDLNSVASGSTSSYMMKFYVENEGEISSTFNIAWHNITNTFCQYRDNEYNCADPTITEHYVGDELKASLYTCSNSTTYELSTPAEIRSSCTKISAAEDQAFPLTGAASVINTTPISINSSTTKYYVIIADIENIASNQNYQQGKSAILGIKIDFNSKRLADAIEMAYPPQSDADVDFGVPSSTSGTNGLYINNKVNIAGDPTLGKIKYFRGNVDNYVEFGTYNADSYHPTSGNGIKEQYTSLANCQTAYPDGNCALYHSAGDPITWRVIRIDETNQVRLITEDTVLPKTAFNPTYDDPKYVGYTWDNDSIPSLSNVKSVIDTWYSDNLSTYADDINHDAEYCNDGSGSTSAFGAYTRLETNKTPTFNCPAPISTYGGTYQLPVGTITADEVAYAGGVYNTANSTYYLYNNTSFWTMSPFYYNGSCAYEFYLHWSAGLHGGSLYNTSPGVRAVITLNANTNVTGQGIATSPWIVQ